jgi:tellurite resistance protein TehA-like permease
MRTSDAIPRSSALLLRDFPAGSFALVMGTGIVAMAARLPGLPLVAWPPFVIALWIPRVLFWIALLAWTLTFAGLWPHFILRRGR